MVIDGLLNVVTFVIFLSCHMANVYACIHLTRSIFSALFILHSMKQARKFFDN